MQSHTLVPGKDQSLETTIEKATGLLNQMGLHVMEVSWLNPAPDCWSVHLEASDCHLLCTNGKGTSRQAALASGLGEFFERLATNFFFADSFIDEGSNILQPEFLFYPNEAWFPIEAEDRLQTTNKIGQKLLDKELLSFYNPEGELTSTHLLDNNTNSENRGICALPFKSKADGHPLFFPVSLLNNLYVSNGMAAGNSPPECFSQALSEILERHVKNIVISNGISLPDVPASLLKGFPKQYTIIKTLENNGLTTRVKDASLGGQFPVICVLLSDTDSGGTFASFGANCRFEIAIERTLTELLQGRNLDRFHDFSPPSHDLIQVAEPFNLESHFINSDGLLSWEMFREKTDYQFSFWDFKGTTREEFSQLKQIINSKGYQIYCAEYLHLGMYSCRFLVPGMSEIYPVDDLVWNNRGTGNQLRSLLLQMQLMEPHELNNILELLESIGLNDQLLLSEIIGILFDKDSAWDTLRIGELKALLYLALKNQEAALDWCSWCLQHAALPPKRKRFFRLLETLLSFLLSGKSLTDYNQGLLQFYRTEELDDAHSVINGTSRFPGLQFASSWQEVSREQKKLLKVYEQINSFKKSPLKL